MRGFGRLVTPNEIEIIDNEGKKVNTITAQKIIIATGARPKSIASIPVDRKMIITSSEAMTLPQLPKELIIVGAAGAIGVEFAASTWFGTKVTIIEMLDSILPIEDKEVSAVLGKKASGNGGLRYLQNL